MHSSRVEVFVHFIWLVGGLVLLYYGAEWLVRGASSLAIRVGISPLVVGLTVVAFGTSMPELLVCVQANSPEVIAAPLQWMGVVPVVDSGTVQASPDIALGNIVGSNIFNIALILGVASLIAPIVIHSQLIRRELPILMLSTVVFAVMMWDMTLERWEGGVLFVGIVAYVVSSVMKSRQDDGSGELQDDLLDEIPEVQEGRGKVLLDICLVIVGIVALVIGADWLVTHGEEIAHAMGVPEVIISLTLFALGTSLPELATSVVAALKRQGDIITGNAIGSCIFNLLAVIGTTAAIKPVNGEKLSWFDMGTMLGLTFLIMPFMWSRMRLCRREGFILTSIAIVYSAVVVLVQR